MRKSAEILKTCSKSTANFVTAPEDGAEDGAEDGGRGRRGTVLCLEKNLSKDTEPSPDCSLWDGTADSCKALRTGTIL